jgi:GDP-4-dehydro-6-deoxy-D-mannose reductase
MSTDRRDGLMRVLVSGAGGFVGPHLLRHLRDAGDEVIGLDLENGPDLLDLDGWVEVVERHRPEVIYHLAGWSDVGGSWRHPITTFQVNALGTLSVLEAAATLEDGPRVVFVSSADVYGIVAPADQPITEQHPVRPRSPYGASKQAAEALCLQHHRGQGLDVVVVRPFNHLGAGQSDRFAAAAFAAQIAEAERRGGGWLRHGDLSARRDLTDVADVVRAYRSVALHGRAGEVYNVCSGSTVAMEDLLTRLVEQATVPIECTVDPARLRPVELPILQGCHDKLTEATGWRPERSLDQTLGDILDDARARVAA